MQKYIGDTGGLSTKNFQPDCVSEESSTDRRS